MLARFYISMICGFAMVMLFQNCGQNPDALDAGTKSGGPITFDVRIFNSTQAVKSCFEIGQVGNIYLNTSPPGKKIDYVIKRNGTTVSAASVVSPAYTQMVYENTSKLGEYSLEVSVKEGSRTVISRSFTFNVKPENGCGGVSCDISANSGLTITVGQPVQYSITSQPAGLEAFLEISENNYNKISVGLTNTSATDTPALSGNFTRAAYVKDSTGTFVKCNSILNITVLPVTPTPTPVGSPTTSPTPVPTPTPTPPVNATGSISISPNYCAVYPASNGPSSCSITATTFAYNTPYRLLYYMENGTLTYFTCVAGEGSMAYPMSVDYVYLSSRYIGTLTRKFYLFAATSCASPPPSPPLNSALAVSIDAIWYDPCFRGCPNY